MVMTKKNYLKKKSPLKSFIKGVLQALALNTDMTFSYQEDILKPRPRYSVVMKVKKKFVTPTTTKNRNEFPLV